MHFIVMDLIAMFETVWCPQGQQYALIVMEYWQIMLGTDHYMLKKLMKMWIPI